MRGLCSTIFAFSLLIIVLTVSNVFVLTPLSATGAGTPEGGAEMGDVVDIAVLGNAIAELAEEHSGDYGVYLKIVDTGEEAGYQADKAYYAASCYKLPLVMYIYELAAAGEVDLDSTIVYGSGDYSSGSGEIQFTSPGSAFTVRELCGYAVSHSDNIAATMLKRVYGYRDFRDYARTLGCPVTGTYGVDKTTAREMGIILERTLRFAEENPLGQEVLGFLRGNTCRSRIPAGLPPGTDVGDKTGDYEGYSNDAAVIFLDDLDYILCILANGAPGDGVHAEISKSVYEHIYNGLYGVYGTVGSTLPGRQWFFGKGTAADGASAWLCMRNPSLVPAEVKVAYRTGPGEGSVLYRYYRIPSLSGMMVNLNVEIGAVKDFSIQLVSSKPIVSERPIYSARL
jgi:beta-lactamase class A